MTTIKVTLADKGRVLATHGTLVGVRLLKVPAYHGGRFSLVDSDRGPNLTHLPPRPLFEAAVFTYDKPATLLKNDDSWFAGLVMDACPGGAEFEIDIA